jgi:hypothetical protein
VACRLLSREARRATADMRKLPRAGRGNSVSNVTPVRRLESQAGRGDDDVAASYRMVVFSGRQSARSLEPSSWPRARQLAGEGGPARAGQRLPTVPLEQECQLASSCAQLKNGCLGGGSATLATCAAARLAQVIVVVPEIRRSRVGRHSQRSADPRLRAVSAIVWVAVRPSTPDLPPDLGPGP